MPADVHGYTSENLNPAFRLPDAQATRGAGCPAGGTGHTADPRELPSSIKDFTGRTGELEWLSRLLDVAAGATGGPVVISAIDGMGGIGMSALAIQAAHQSVAAAARRGM